MQDLGYAEIDAFTEQRRVRHLTEVLVRNLSIPAALVQSSASGSWVPRSASAFAANASAVAGPSSRSNTAERFPAHATPPRSKDDLDLHIPRIRRRRSDRRKLTVSTGSGTTPTFSDGIARDIDQPSSSDTLQPATRRSDVKGKGRESNLTSSRETLDSIREGEDVCIKKSSATQMLERDDSDLVFGWTSGSRTPVPLQLERSKSKSSLKSSSSKRSISSSVSKRLFKQNRRRRSSLIGSEDDEDDSESSEGHSPRKNASGKYERPASPLSPHVSFQMASSYGHAWSPGIDSAFDGDVRNNTSAASRRARSASRGSVFSIVSGSSASTLRASTMFRHSEREERFLRLKRSENIRSHLVRSRLALFIPNAQAVDTKSANVSMRPSLPRPRTVSLPLKSDAGREYAWSTPGANSIQTPFYISEPHKKSMEPSFPLDFTSRPSLSVQTPRATKSHRIVVQIWIEYPNDSTSRDQSEEDVEWSLLLEWDVDLRRLISLGTDPRLFPRHLPSNTLILRTNNTDEYLTARLPSFLLATPLVESEGGDLMRDRLDDNDDMETGNLSDPGPATSFFPRYSIARGDLSLKQNVGRERERLVARRQMVLDRSVRETRMVQSVDDEELRRVVTMEQQMLKTRADIIERQTRLDQLLIERPFHNERQHNVRIVMLQRLEEDKSSLQSTQELGLRQCTRKRSQLQTRRHRLESARNILQAKEASLEQSQTDRSLDMDVYRSILLSGAQRRASIIGQLSAIFPIDLVDATNILFSICGMPLPNGDFETSLQRSSGLDFDDDHISSALGFVAQAVQLLAAYLTIPLYYPIRCMGSRSLVQDPISQMKGPKIFPLYSRGVDQYRFEYAVFLLNKNIEQIMLEHNIGVMDLTQTLPNLKNIYLTLSSDAILRTSTDLSSLKPSFNKVSKTTQPILLGNEAKLAKPSSDISVDYESHQEDNLAITPTANGRIVSQPNGTTASTLEKLLGSGWSSRATAPPGNAHAVASPTKGRRRHAEASKTMTLLGGRSSLSITH